MTTRLRCGLRTTVPPQNRPVLLPSVQKNVPTWGSPWKGWLGGTGAADGRGGDGSCLLTTTGSAAFMRPAVQYASTEEAGSLGVPAACAGGVGTASSARTSTSRAASGAGTERPRAARGLPMDGFLSGGG